MSGLHSLGCHVQSPPNSIFLRQQPQRHRLPALAITYIHTLGEGAYPNKVLDPGAALLSTDLSTGFTRHWTSSIRPIVRFFQGIAVMLYTSQASVLCRTFSLGRESGPERGVIIQGVSSLEQSLESLTSKSLTSLESLANGRILLCFPRAGSSLESLESLNKMGTVQEHNSSEKYWQYTSNLYRSTPPICNAVPCWLLSLAERETPQYASHLYRSTPPICTGVAFERIAGTLFPEPLFVRSRLEGVS